MPNRIIKESICSSDNIDQLSAFEETVFVRLLVNCDDFGRFDARPKMLSSRLFPLRKIEPEVMTEALESLVKADLVTLYEANGKPFLYVNTWSQHQQTRATKSKYPDPSDSACNQLISDDSKCPRNRIRNRNTINDNRIRNTEGFIDDDEAKAIQSDQDRILDAAEDAGFLKSNSVRAKLLTLFADYGLEKMLAGFDSCVKHGAPNIAYLEACLKDAPRKQKPKVNAQEYEQRNYSGVQDELLDEQAREIEEKLKRKAAAI